MAILTFHVLATFDNIEQAAEDAQGTLHCDKRWILQSLRVGGIGRRRVFKVVGPKAVHYLLEVVRPDGAKVLSEVFHNNGSALTGGQMQIATLWGDKIELQDLYLPKNPQGWALLVQMDRLMHGEAFSGTQLSWLRL